MPNWETQVYQRTGVSPTGCPKCNPTGMSNAEKDLVSVVRSLLPGVVVQENVKGLLPGSFELDIVIPDLKVAIEFNGLRWHSECAKKDKNCHLKKLNMCSEMGYRRIQIWEDDWRDRRDVTIRSLAHKLNATRYVFRVLEHFDSKMSEKVMARKLTVGVVTGREARDFLNANHMQGAVSATYHLALFDCDGDIRALMSLRSPRQNARMHRADGEWEVQRYATLGIVSGGFSKLLTAAENLIRENGLTITRWVSFAANDISDGGLYESSGFVVANVIGPDYKYVGDKTHWRRVAKEGYQKKRFRTDDTLVWDESWTEHEAALANKLYRIYDAGKIKYVKPVSN